MPEIVISDPWKLSSGLRDDMVASITDAYFAPDAEYQGGRVLLLHLIGIDETGEAFTLKLSAGADWETADGGNTITHPTKKQQRINSSTIYGHWIANAQEIPELVDELQRRPGGPLNAKVWEGLIIHLLLKEIRFGRNIDPQQRLMPAEYFGVMESQPDPVAVQGVPFVPVTPAPPVAQPSPIDPQLLLAQARAQAAAPTNGSSPLYNELVNLAKTLDWPQYLATVLADPRVLADDELAQQAIDQNQLYNSARV